jgi:hypothetical protein
MKNLTLLASLISIIISCSSDKEIDIQTDTEKWQLTEMTGNIANVPPLTGSGMNWQEWYLLNSNHTFTKTREQDGATRTATGTYAITVLSDGKYIEFTYETGSELAGSCTLASVEQLRFINEDKLMGTWAYCDGPGLTYKKMDVSRTEN